MSYGRKNRIHTNLDTHHLLWIRRAWNKGSARTLRDFWYCQIKIPRKGLHRHIHEEVCKIPVPDACICEDCLDTGDSPTAEALKHQLEAVTTYKPE